MKNPVYEWLVYPESITKRLNKKAGDASITILAQEWKPIDWSNQWVAIDSNEKTWCREITMSAYGKTCWYARSLVPEKTYTHCAAFFEQLKLKTLGQLIFNSPIVERTLLTHYSIDADRKEYQWMPEEIKPIRATRLWVRFSWLMLHNQFPFYLVEIMLPAVERYSD